MVEIQDVPLIEAAGTPAAIGYSIGEQSRDQISATIDLYAEIFARPKDEIFRAAEHFRVQIERFAPSLSEEISAMAEAAKVDRRWLFTLNARSELLSALAVGECTSVHFTETPFLGQNWDWLEPLEELMMLQRITDTTGHTTLMLTEPGIVGKIGLNSAGIGVCLNFLPTSNPTLGVPTHILLRHLLSARTWSELQVIVGRAGSGRSANLLIADETGRSLNIEFDGLNARTYEAGPKATAHTNHYLASEIPVAEVLFENSNARLNRARVLVENLEDLGLKQLKTLLSDTSDQKNPILAPYREIPAFRGKLGTDCSIAMDLERRQMHFRRGNDPRSLFEGLPVQVDFADRKEGTAI
ncbi:C45 family peptidase [Ruegeria sp. EL01]|jgi:isopenicillin-N N-acyltransferase-like protein|uniref:C45 family autoproteolytic acyltransferase/hydolase n=1 Tax=Ruegeria sp. EL01 TaxID=2107578 RepID=UPI000EA7FC61|nr:C45 family peptidase [Ruegeria sp. EL01]